MANTLTDADAILKQTYPDDLVEMDYERSRTLSLIRKSKGALHSNPFGQAFRVPTKIGNPQAGGADFAAGYAQSATETARYEDWWITPKTWWQWADVAGETLRRTDGVGSFVNAAVIQIESAKKAMMRLYEIMLFKGGWGDLAQLSASAAVGSATGVALANAWMSRFCERGMSVVFSASEAANTLRGVTPVKITARRSGQLDFAFAPNTAGTAAAAGDVMFRFGDRQNSATPARQVTTGLKAWCPTSAPSATLFNQVDRTVDDRLYGRFQDALLSGSPEEAFMDGFAQVKAEGGLITHVPMGPLTYNKVCKSMNNHLDVCEITRDIGMGIPAVRLRGSDAVFYEDSACEEGNALGFNIEELSVEYAGKDLFYIERGLDGNMFREVAGTDSWRARLVTSSDLVVPAPSQNLLHVFNL
jgi:hypothetical protein